MSFNSFEYALFLGLTIVCCWSLRQIRQQNALLLLASYFFYASWDWRLLPLLVFTTIVNFVIGRALETAPTYRLRIILITSIVVNMGILAFFKYFNFFVDSAIKLLTNLGLQANPSSLSIILPIGISFYTFTVISYVIDVYRRQIKPSHDFLEFALFVGFFPQLLAGPIERAAHLLPQIKERQLPNPEQIESGVLLIFLGLFKKIVIADVAANLINSGAFSAPGNVQPGVVLQAVYLFAVQIYGDFSGYSDIARGSARLLGFELIKNFTQPYFSANIAEFWGRWHISLSTWLRDYLFYPFSRSMLRRFGSHRAIQIQISAHMLTLFASGLWHGANLTFVLWGLLHGIYLSSHRLLLNSKLLPIKFESPLGNQIWHILSAIVTFHLVLIAWVLFRIPSIRFAPAVYGRLIESFTLGLGSDGFQLFLPVILLYVALLGIDAGQRIFTDETFFRLLPSLGRSVIYVTAVFFMILFALKPYVPFFYFRF